MGMDKEDPAGKLPSTYLSHYKDACYECKVELAFLPSLTSLSYLK